MNDIKRNEKKIKRLKNTLKGLDRRFENLNLLEENFKILFNCFYEIYENLEDYNLNYQMLEAFRKVLKTLREKRAKLKNTSGMRRINEAIILIEALQAKFGDYAYKLDD